MTDDRMVLLELIEKSADADLVREMLGFAAERLMEAEVQARTGGTVQGLGDGDGNVMTSLAEAGWESVNGVGVAAGRDGR